MGMNMFLDAAWGVILLPFGVRFLFNWWVILGLTNDVFYHA